MVIHCKTLRLLLTVVHAVTWSVFLVMGWAPQMLHYTASNDYTYVSTTEYRSGKNVGRRKNEVGTPNNIRVQP